MSTDGQTLDVPQSAPWSTSLGHAWADTTTQTGKLWLMVLAGLAEYERHLIMARTSEGRQPAQ